MKFSAADEEPLNISKPEEYFIFIQLIILTSLKKLSHSTKDGAVVQQP